MDNESRQGIKFLITLHHPFCFIELVEKIVKWYLRVYEVAAILPARNFKVFVLFLRNIAYDGFQNVIEGDESLHRAIFIHNKTMVYFGSPKLLQNLVSSDTLRNVSSGFHNFFEGLIGSGCKKIFYRYHSFDSIDVVVAYRIYRMNYAC